MKINGGLWAALGVFLVVVLPLGASARWISVDPLASKYPGVSPYTYVRNNPLSRVDPDGLTDVTLTVQRTDETTGRTVGTYQLSNSGDKHTASGFTLEKPWKNNAEYTSRIPAGSYPAKVVTTQTFKYPHLSLSGVPGRSDIVVHRGNTVGDTKGCILVGQKLDGGTIVPGTSTAATNQIENYISRIQQLDQEKGQTTSIIVKVIDPPKPTPPPPPPTKKDPS
jgi:uncharacterized protein RhaS with RHS repeats